ncbi:MAG TPA: protein translocase subunit SecD [Ktedonobacteraceae bacterium]|nr:protein translocase subunit SecD [Ktedonobacteraceae bacterium]
MRRGTPLLLFLIILLAAAAGYVLWPNNPGVHIPFLGINTSLQFQEGLDLQGGISVQLAPTGYGNMSQSDLAASVATAEGQIAERVSGGLGVTDATIRQQTVNGLPGLLVELPGLNSGDQQAAIQSITNSGILEFWNTGSSQLTEGTTFDPSQYTQYNAGGKPLFTGKDLNPSSISVGTDEAGRPDINFAMQGSAISKFYTFTESNVGSYLTVTLDRKVIQSAVIQSGINGPGEITGQFTPEEAQSIVSLLKYGALPVGFTVASQQTIGATLGVDSLQKSLFAGVTGLIIVMLFMMLFYRLPGLLADVALLLYAGVTLAIFKVGAFTLSLAGIAGFILSVGMAVDANVLIFERIKEELRAGRLLASAIDIGWKRAWPSIRDSNASTMMTCAVLYFFGSNFGATMIVGFATTLFLGVLISLFTAVVVTRTFLNLLVPTGVINHPWFFGLPREAVAAASSNLARRNSASVEGNLVRGESRV